MLHTLDLFILALIADRSDTPYRWQRNAALSTGATLPAVRRLIDGKLVREERAGPRNRRQFSLPQRGRAELRNLGERLEAALRDDIRDFEALLRLVSLAAADGKRDLAINLLKQAASDRKRSLPYQLNILPDPLPTTAAAFYSVAIAQYEHGKHQAAIRCIESLLKSLGPKNPRKSGAAAPYLKGHTIRSKKP